MIDIHSHILPGIDDGPETLDEAVSMLHIAAADGTTEMVATPHANPTYVYDCAVIDARIAELRALCPPTLTIRRGCDLHLSVENIEETLLNPFRFSINGGRYLLVELPDFFHPTAMGAIFGRLIAAGLTPVITHPERNPSLCEQVRLLRSWTERGCLTQVTAQSFLGTFGAAAKNAAVAMLASGLVHFVASDAHDLVRRPPLLSGAWAYLEQNYGAETARVLCDENPRATLTGEPVTRLPERKPRSFWSLRR